MKNLYPKKIIKIFGDVTNADNLLVEKETQIGISERETTEMKGASAIILDFGKEIAGGIRILTYNADNNKKVRIRFGESVSETCSEIGCFNSTNDHSTRDMTVELQSYSDMPFGNTGFRFIRIDAYGAAEIRVKSVIAALSVFEEPFCGSFECDDEKINEIWNTAAYTMRLCVQNGYLWDGIKRDRLVWIGDIHPEMMSCLCLFGDIPNIKASLDFVKKQTPLPGWMNNIPTYSLWWIIILADYYRYSGNLKYLSEQKEYFCGLLKQIDLCVSEDGNINFQYNFIDWSTHFEGADGDLDKKNDELAGVNALTRIAILKASYISSVINCDGKICDGILSKLGKNMMAIKKFKQTAALSVLAGDLSENNKQILLSGGAEGMSCFMNLYILTALSKYGFQREALGMIKEYYGGMLSLGATTFWEDFDINWLSNAGRIDEYPCGGKIDVHKTYGKFCYTGYRHSLCHGWSSGVIPYLVNSVLGVRFEDGCKTVYIKPNMCGLKRVKGSFPTPYGVIDIEHTLCGGEIKTVVNAPKEIKIIE